MLDAVESIDGVVVRSLYDRYPDFVIDVEAEQKLLSDADAVVFQHPIYWYAAPALLKLWFEKVLTVGFAYGAGGDALLGKRCLWAVTTGGDKFAYSEEGMHENPFTSFVPAMRQTAHLCKMLFDEPFVVHSAQRISKAALVEAAETYRDRVRSLIVVNEDAADA